MDHYTRHFSTSKEANNYKKFIKSKYPNAKVRIEKIKFNKSGLLDYLNQIPLLNSLIMNIFLLDSAIMRKAKAKKK